MKLQVTSYKLQVLFILLLSFLSFIAPSSTFAQTQTPQPTSSVQSGQSNCVVTKVGNPAISPTLPPECASGAGGTIFPPGMVGPDSNGYYQLPSASAPTDGYTTLTCSNHHWGSKSLVGVLYTIARQWKQKYPQGYIRIGDLNAIGHISHNKGFAVDIDATTNGTDCVAGYINNGHMGRSCATVYNREATIELGKMFVDTMIIKQILYLDTTVNAALHEYVQSKSLDTQFYEVALHDDHFHIDIKLNPELPFWEPTC